MVFAYYHRLNKRQQRIYQQSDAVASISLPDAGPLHDLTQQLSPVLAQGKRPAVEQLAQQLATEITTRLGVAPLRVKVLTVRPNWETGELHGEYSRPATRRGTPVISVWMRTAARGQVVAFRTFLRTLLHEICHHLDYELLKLADSLHTEGFYKRESSLLRQLAGAHAAPTRRTATGAKIKARDN
ncbi:MAG: hypothetical protein M1392_06300 [Gammaproteobacteria bacterium]|nr:hypothetical protein [Gammaproteobacteria bacterium]